MKRFGMGLLAVFAVVSASPALAQTATCASESTYYVRPGDSLYKLRKDDWPTAMALNPQLAEPGRAFTTKYGQEGIRLNVGEPLCGIVGSGTGGLALASDVTVQQEKTYPLTWQRVVEWASWLFGALAALALLLYLWGRHELGKDPVTSRAPMRRDGVSNEQEARERFNGIARNVVHNRDFLIENIVAGHASGPMMVRYGDGTERPRMLHNERVYQATIRYSDDGTTDQVYMLQACGNDLRSGGIIRYITSDLFRFTPEQVYRSEPTATPAPAAPAIVAANQTGGDETAPTPVFAMGSEGEITFDRTKVVVNLEEGGRTTIRPVPVAVQSAEQASESPQAPRQAS